MRDKLLLVLIFSFFAFDLGCASRVKEADKNDCGAGVPCFFYFILPASLVAGTFKYLIKTAERMSGERKRLEQAPERMDDTARILRAWLPECKEILRAEVTKHHPLFTKGSDTERARAKSLGLINGALNDATSLYDANPCKEGYDAKQFLTRLSNCCTSCPAANSVQSVQRPFCAAVDGKGKTAPSGPSKPLKSNELAYWAEECGVVLALILSVLGILWFLGQGCRSVFTSLF